jgi:hypothetical protein
MKRILIWLLIPVWLPVLLAMRLFKLGDLTQADVARRRLSYTIGASLLKAQQAHARVLDEKQDSPIQVMGIGDQIKKYQQEVTVCCRTKFV